MKPKQIVGLVAALVVFALTGLVGVLSAVRLNKAKIEAAEAQKEAGGILRDFWDGFLPDDDTENFDFPKENFLAVVRVEDMIADEPAAVSLLGASSGYDHSFTLAYLDALTDCPENTGILLYVDSPGGYMDTTDELYLSLMDYKKATGRPIYAYFDSMACSGGYYAAMAADEICANRNCTCVNIGVYLSAYNFSELFDRLGVEQVVIRSGKNKGIGLEGQPWTKEQKEIYQSMIDLQYEQFLEIVAKGRGMSMDEVRAKDDGREMLAAQALEAGFIDSISRYDDYLSAVLEKLDTDTYYEATPGSSYFDLLSGYLRSNFGRSENDALLDFAKAHQGVRIMAYAELY